jgi:sarcosine oxidase subunit alpha
MSQPGTTVQIRIEGGTLVEAEVVSTPFYDPQNARQN